MLNRSLNPVLVRLAIVAAALALLTLVAPVAFADSHIAISYAENGTDAVLTFSATDADGDEIKWSLDGVDKADFTIEGGVLAFKKSPNFEGATDRDEIPNTESVGDQGAKDNVYKVIVKANGGSQPVEVTVTNVDEAGSVTFTQPQPQATREIEAMFDDDDGDKEPSWQWSMGPTDEGPWAEIDGATTAKRNPTADEVYNYLRATVSYTDSFGAQTASGVTDNAVEERTLSNALPKFEDIDPIEIAENTSGDIGDPVTASDADNDVLLYDFGTLDANNDNDLFDVGRTTGQLSVKGDDGIDFETPGADKSANAQADDGIPDGVIVYTVVLTATDPSGAPGTGSVSVYLSNVNEAPEFDDSKEQTTLYIAENGEPNNGLFTDKGLGADDAVDPYQATDPDTDDTGTAYTLEGAGSDEASFTLDPTNGD